MSGRLTAFYGFPAELIASWCGVEVETARGWKSGKSVPSRQSLMLFVLHRDRRVLGDGWQDWIVDGEALIDPEGNSTSQGLLRAYALVVQYVVERARIDRAARDLISVNTVAVIPAGGSEPKASIAADSDVSQFLGPG
jgi:hypothetical protein